MSGRGSSPKDALIVVIDCVVLERLYVPFSCIVVVVIVDFVTPLLIAAGSFVLHSTNPRFQPVFLRSFLSFLNFPID